MSNDKYLVRQIGPAEFDVLVPLMKDCFGLTVDINYFRWKYTQNPAGDFIGFIAVEKNTNEVGAYYGVIPELFMINGKEKVIYQSCDTMTHSRHRRLGLFQLLAMHCYDYLDKEGKLNVYGFGGGQSTPGFIKFGWTRLFDLVVSFYPKQLNIFSNLSLPKKERERVIDMADLSGLEELVLKSNENAAVHPAKKPANFLWRIANPMHQYHVLGYKREDGNWDGYLIYYAAGAKYFLFDWFFLNRKAEKALMRTLKRRVAADAGIKGIITMIRKGTPGHQALRRNMFLINPFKKGPLHERTPFIVYSRDKNAGPFLNDRSWEPMPYDHDSL